MCVSFLIGQASLPQEILDMELRRIGTTCLGDGEGGNGVLVERVDMVIYVAKISFFWWFISQQLWFIVIYVAKITLYLANMVNDQMIYDWSNYKNWELLLI